MASAILNKSHDSLPKINTIGHTSVTISSLKKLWKLLPITILAKITPCFENGKLGIAADLSNGIGFGSSEYIVFRPDSALSKEWLYYFLSRESFRVEGAERMSGAVGHKRVAKEFIEAYPIPIPPLPEQQRIVGILDEALAGIATAKANAEKNLQNAHALFESHLQAVFSQRGEGWVETIIGDCIHFIDYRGKTPEKTASGLRLITAKNVKMGFLQGNRSVPLLG